MKISFHLPRGRTHRSAQRRQIRALESHSMTLQTRFGVVLFVSLLVMSFARCANKTPDVTKNPAMQEIKVTVRGEYLPDRIVVKKGRPVRLLFFREDDSECTAQVVIPDLKVKQELAVKQETTLEFVPD